MDRNLYDVSVPEMIDILSLRESKLEELAKEFPTMHPMEIRTVFDEYWENHTESWGSAMDYLNHGVGSKDLFATVFWLKSQLAWGDTKRYLKDEADAPPYHQAHLFAHN